LPEMAAGLVATGCGCLLSATPGGTAACATHLGPSHTLGTTHDAIPRHDIDVTLGTAGESLSLSHHFAPAARSSAAPWVQSCLSATASGVAPSQSVTFTGEPAAISSRASASALPPSTFAR